MAKSEVDDWWEAFGYLSPEDQQATLADMGYSNGGVQDPGFSYYGSGLDDYPIEGVAATPEFTTKGALDPRDLTQVAKGINVAQDYGSLLVDNALTGLAGPGAFDVDSFTPEIEYGKEVTRPGNDRLQAYAQRSGWEGFLANEILKGGTPSSAMSSLQQKLESVDLEDPDLAPNEREALQSLSNSLPKFRQLGATPPSEKQDLGFWGKYDYDTIYKTATDYSDAVFKDPGYGYEEVGADGKTRYYDQAPTEIKTDQMKFYDKYGLPYPTKSYEDPDYLNAMLDAEEGTTAQQREQQLPGYARSYTDAFNERKQAEQNVQLGAQREDLMRKAFEEMSAPPQRTGPADNPYGLSPDSMTAARTAADLDFQNADQSGAPTRDTFLQQAMARAGRTTPQASTEGLGSPTSNLNRGASREAAGVAADIDFEQAMKDWQEEQKTKYLDEAMLRGATNSRTTPMMRLLPTGQLDLLKAGGPESLFNVEALTKGGYKTLDEKTVSQKERYKRTKATNDKAVAARQRQQDVEGADPRLNDIKAAAQLYWLTKNGRTPYKDAMAQRRLGASRLGL